MRVKTKNIKNIGNKFLLLFAAASLQLLPALALACDPHKNCVRDWGWPIGKVRSPECELEREMCRHATCVNIAKDANGYIDGANAQIAEIDMGVAARHQHKLQTDMAVGQAIEVYNNQQNICLDLKNLTDQSVAQTGASVRIVSFLQDYFRREPANLIADIANSAHLTPSEKNITLEFVNLKSRDEAKIREAVNNFSGELTPGLLELISAASAVALNSCSSQSNQLRLNYENLVQARGNLDVEDADAAARRQGLVDFINQQEARKCR